MSNQFKAFLVDKNNDGSVNSDFTQLTTDDLPEGEVLIKVHYSGINYKDALATTDNNQILKSYPMVPGIDLAGTVVKSEDPTINEGEEVIVTSYDMGVSHYGGFSEYARVNSDWVVKLPDNMTLEEAMIYGTAGYTAGLAIEKLEKAGFMTLEGGKVLVRGASGGVGALAVLMLSNLGYKVVASTGNKYAGDKLEALGANEIIDRITDNDEKPLGSRTWQAAIDPIGGNGTPYVTNRIDNNGGVALIGLTGGVSFDTTVYPFILRGVSLVGIDSVFTPMKLRERVWRRLATDLKSDKLHDIKKVISFSELPDAISTVLNHDNFGRIIIDFDA
ncbi:acryloyl-CoA reductase [Staphylococcus haemolyticus]|uniref:Acryloyl-CoA reductase n=1 Tax=Staphylococcus haemolyticus TaxID=1283 RepID=A0AB38PER3_STAHA|nr:MULTISPECIES: acryloyl-CoA reductase [Staphylococcus]SIJ73604.1 zinc-containing alcohol dehydrogenase superfamily protein [Mycobacteroides abscessus subsp. abscessus]MBE7355905.1 acryloyl-CoA reductase [Staphylococcus haemolyticus]MCE4987631.1 acryloyl-CoA reductase [Staphylococcus haemolyticus]MCE4992289.1 acryloyl-CoA reductase [Staphylococcus haemolyticus]MCE5050398.1 acryloyl-CoA reductase [Staphylococcus haemolyticus]